MLILPNCILFNIELDNQNRTYHFNDERLKNSEIVSMMAYSTKNDFVASTPYDYETNPMFDVVAHYPTEVSLQNISIYAKLFRKGVKMDFDIDIINLGLEQDNRVDFLINQQFEMDKSFLEVKGNVTNKLLIPLYIFYKTKPLNKQLEYNAISTYKVTRTDDEKTLPLSDIVGNGLRGKAIKKIVVSSVGSPEQQTGFLDIVGKDNRRLEMLPLSLFRIRDTKQVYLDPIVIDYEQSKLVNFKGNSDLEITFFH